MSNIDDRLAFLRLTGRWNSQMYRWVPQEWTQKNRLRFAPSEGYRIFDREVSKVISGSHRDLTRWDAYPWLAQRLRDAISRRALAQRCSLFTHKFTGWPRAGFLSEVFVDAKFVHVMRDGRAVANSLLQSPWWTGFLGPNAWSLGPLNSSDAAEWRRRNCSLVCLAGLAWKILIEAHERAMQDLDGNQWLTVKYEDLVHDPHQGFQEILNFLGLDMTHDFTKSLSRYRFRPERQRAFVRELGGANVEMLNQVLCKHLIRYGYIDETNWK